MSYIGIPWDEQRTVRGKMRTVVSRFLGNFSNASEDDWEVFFRESERHLRRFAKYTVRYNDLPRASAGMATASAGSGLVVPFGCRDQSL